MEPLSPRAVMIIMFASVTMLTVVVGLLLLGRDAEVEQRLGDLADPQRALLRRRAPSQRRVGRSLQALLANVGVRLMPTANTSHGQLQEQFVSAGIYSPSAPYAFATIRFICGLILPAIVLMAGNLEFVEFWRGLAAGCVLGVLGMLGPGIWLRSRIARRQMLLRTSLPDFLDLTVTCLEAGQSFEAALQRVTDELRTAHPVLALELTIVQRELALGATPFRAIRNFSERSRLDVVRTLATFVDQAQKFGSSMVESLRTHAEMLREMREQRAEELAQKAAVKILLPTMFFIFPPILVTLAGPAVIEFQQKLCADDIRDVRSE
ncbi:MAG: type II secretion system F family protein [Planctomycetaceae bacterium]